MTTATLRGGESPALTLDVEIPSEWRIATLGQLFEIQQGKALSPQARTGPNRRPFLRTANLLWSRLDLTTVDQMHFTDEEAARFNLLPGDLLICEGGEVGRAAIWRGEIDGCSYQNHIHRLRPTGDEAVPEFYMYWMRAALLHLGLYVGAENRTTIPNLSKGRLSRFVVPVPPVVEQKAIVSALSAIQRAIGATQRVSSSAETLKLALIGHLFASGHAPLGEGSASGAGPREAWQLTDLRSVTVPTHQVNPSASPDLKVQYVDVSSVSNSSLSIQSWTEYLGASAPGRARKQVQEGDVIFATIRPGLRRIARVPRELDGEVASTAFCVIRPNAALVKPSYVFHAVARREFVDAVARQQHGSSYPAVTDRQVLAELIPVPPLAEQTRIAEVLDSADHKIRAESARETALQALFDALLPELLTGRRRVEIRASV